LAKGSWILGTRYLSRRSIYRPIKDYFHLGKKSPDQSTEVQAFLGLAGYYRKFVEGFSSIAHSMTQLLKKDKKFEWTEKCKQSFQELKKRLVSAPILTMPDITKSFDVYCDDSKTWECSDARWQGHCLLIPSTAPA
jgi:hypothetical protein